MKPTRSALRYYGGKWRLADWILGHFPEHTCYVEPYAGGASVLLQKAPAPFEVLNDIDGDVISFFRVLRERPADLVKMIELTPYARLELEQSYEPTDQDLERARRLYVRSHMARGVPGTSRRTTGWRYQRRDNQCQKVTDRWSTVDHLFDVAARLKLVQIECDDAIAVIRRFDTPGTLHYVDPPYVLSTRNNHWDRIYTREMLDEEHRQLAEVLHQLQGMVILSGYPSSLYAELFGDWTSVECLTRTDASSTAVERLWLSPRVARRAQPQRLFPDGAA